jgi:hypothetical protein
MLKKLKIIDQVKTENNKLREATNLLNSRLSNIELLVGIIAGN